MADKGDKKKKYDYFDDFKMLSEIAIEEADLLVECIEDFSSAEELKPALERAHDIERAGDDVNHDVLSRVATDFITPIEREDLIDMAESLDDVVDCIESVIQHFYLYDVHFMHHDALDFAKLIKKSCESLDAAMKDFRNFKKSKSFKKLILSVTDNEEEADRLYAEVIRKLYTHDVDNPLRVQVWTQLFHRMENCCDACEHAADTMNSIMLRNV